MDINEVVLPKRNRCSCGGYGELHEWGVISVKGSKSFMTCSHCDKRTKVCSFEEYGTRVKVLGHVYTVQDRMASGWGRHLDIFMEDYGEAVQFGRRELPVEVLE